jgi:hypothetical protein
LKVSNKPKDNLSGAERRALRSLRTNYELTVIHADKGNGTVVLDTLDYNAIPSLWVQLSDIQPTKVLFVKDKLPDGSVFPPVSIALV